MKKASIKLLLASSALLFANSVSADTTICYKKDWTSPSTIEKTKLDGGVCKGELSLIDMKKNGWKLKDIKITSSDEGLNYQYVLTTDDIIKVDNNAALKIQNQKPLSFKEIKTSLKNVNNKTASINIGNLRVGQSGIVLKEYENGQKLIVSNAYVTKTSENSSEIKFIPFMDLKQNAIPTSNAKPKNGDTLILNYMYDKSLLIAPSQDAFQVARGKFRLNTFLHSDIFAANLKSQREPLPSKSTIQDFAIEQNLGTIFIVIKNKAYVVDSKTFAILDFYTLAYNYLDTEKMPFYTRIEGIEEAPFAGIIKSITELSFLKDIFGDDERSEEEILLEGEMKKDEIVNKNDMYNDYYRSILGLK